MAWKLILNVLYTIGIFLCAVVAFTAYQRQNYFMVLGAVFIGGLIIIFKIKLLRDVKGPKNVKPAKKQVR